MEAWSHQFVEHQREELQTLAANAINEKKVDEDDRKVRHDADKQEHKMLKMTERVDMGWLGMLAKREAQWLKSKYN